MRIGYLAEHFGVHEPPGITLPRFNIAPGEGVTVITRNEHAQVIMMHWGLIPSWTRGEKPAQAPVNARAEGLSENKLFRSLLLHGRCVVPATGFYEWEKSGNQKTPYYFRMKTQEIFGMAGLCDSWKAPDGRMVWSFTIITTRPNSLVTPIHNRMPAILNREEVTKWLDPGCDIREGLATMLNPYPPDNMMAYRVTKMVNNPSFKSETTVQEENTGTTSDLFAWDTR